MHLERLMYGSQCMLHAVPCLVALRVHGSFERRFPFSTSVISLHSFSLFFILFHRLESGAGWPSLQGVESCWAIQVMSISPGT